MSTAIRRMVLGTGSGVGKSLMVAGMCRAAARMGIRVLPFKSQNMSNNSAVLAGGGEIARAQALQARACFVDPDASMNPILLKPMEGGRCQVIFMGQPLGIYSIVQYRELKKLLFPKVCDVFETLASRADLIILEGAGSPAEINLLEEDLANTRMARAVGASAMLLGDIEHGGVFASLFGTFELLPPEDRKVIRWFGINKFRGDPSLLTSGMEAITLRTGRPFLGVMDHLGPLDLPDEDSYRVRPTGGRSDTTSSVRLAVIEWPHLSNRSDLDPFLGDQDVSVHFVPLSGPWPTEVDAIILPGTRETMQDLRAFIGSAIYPGFQSHLKAGKSVVGICGGYQMMGEEIRDPEGVESKQTWMPGLSLLPMSVHFQVEKIARPVFAKICQPPFRGGENLVGATVEGYEIRHGRQKIREGALPIFALYDSDGRFLGHEGLSNEAGTILGSPIHGLFDNGPFRASYYLRALGKPAVGLSATGTVDRIDHELDRVADAVVRAFSMEEFFGVDRQPNAEHRTVVRTDGP